MIVCLCRGVADREIAEAVRCGATSIDDISRACAGAGGDCGTCRPHIEEYLRGRHADGAP